MFFITNGIDGYKKAFCYKGVADRKTYFFFVLFQTPISVLMIWVSIYLESISQSLNEDTLIGSIILLFSQAQLAASIYIFLASLAFAVRRLHDIDLSGWWVILIYCVIYVTHASTTSADQDLFNNLVGEVVWLGSHLLLALPKSKIENNKYRPADSIFIPAKKYAKLYLPSEILIAGFFYTLSFYLVTLI